jgi:hypothetical protein
MQSIHIEFSASTSFKEEVQVRLTLGQYTIGLVLRMKSHTTVWRVFSGSQEPFELLDLQHPHSELRYVSTTKGNG